MSQPPRNLVILGSTGSIGRSALRVVQALPERFRVLGLAVHRQGEEALRQAQEFHAPFLAVADPASARRAAAAAPGDVQVLAGAEGLLELVAQPGVDLVLAAIVGMAGLPPVLRALELGVDVALATKETLVVAGAQVMAARRRSGARLLPVDSEHSAIFQCLEGRPADHVRKLILTASGGPFAGRPDLDWNTVTVDAALRHPRWNMGRKVTVDSATMMNKGLEIMEARWLFDVDLDRIEVMLHPESIVHSMVELTDGSLLAQLSASDMRFAIQYALTWPQRLDGQLPPLDLARLGALHFSLPDAQRFPCLALTRAAARAGGTMPAVLNAANEVAVEAFLAGRLPFAGIWRVVEETMAVHQIQADPELADIMEADRWARIAARERVGHGTPAGMSDGGK